MRKELPTVSNNRNSEQSVDFNGVSCPVPLQDYPHIILGHGGGGKLSSELIEHIFLPAFKNKHLAGLGDSTVFNVESGRLAFSTDSFVVQPLFFPGGSIGDLAVNGTVNDVSMSGAKPLYLSAGFIIEEGFPVAQLKRIADDMGAAARRAGLTQLPLTAHANGRLEGNSRTRRLGLRTERDEPPERRHPAVAGAVEREADDEGSC